jgi:GNAT superfamily N-acetyltransferase
VVNGRFRVREAGAEDAPALAELYEGSGLEGAPADEGEAARMLQTGHAFLVAEDGAGVAGAVRWREEEGIAWFDLLRSLEPWAGADLVRAVGRRAQDHGLRLARCRAPGTRRLAGYFARLGFLPIGREAGAGGEPVLLLERRLPLLTVREQRREDAPAIGRLTGADPWPFEQGARPGWFVAADGERVVGVTGVTDARGGLATISEPVVDADYAGRGLETWLVERARQYAETHGFHTCELAATPRTLALRRALEDRLWHLDGARFVRVMRRPAGATE